MGRHAICRHAICRHASTALRAARNRLCAAESHDARTASRVPPTAYLGRRRLLARTTTASAVNAASAAKEVSVTAAGACHRPVSVAVPALSGILCRLSLAAIPNNTIEHCKQACAFRALLKLPLLLPLRLPLLQARLGCLVTPPLLAAALPLAAACGGRGVGSSRNAQWGRLLCSAGACMMAKQSIGGCSLMQQAKGGNKQGRQTHPP